MGFLPKNATLCKIKRKEIPSNIMCKELINPPHHCCTSVKKPWQIRFFQSLPNFCPHRQTPCLLLYIRYKVNSTLWKIKLLKETDILLHLTSWGPSPPKMLKNLPSNAPFYLWNLEFSGIIVPWRLWHMSAKFWRLHFLKQTFQNIFEKIHYFPSQKKFLWENHLLRILTFLKKL